MASEKEPLWLPMTHDEQSAIYRALILAFYLEADPVAAVKAGHILTGLTQPGRRLGVTCDPV
jgi:hypothetical protein